MAILWRRRDIGLLLLLTTDQTDCRLELWVRERIRELGGGIPMQRDVFSIVALFANLVTIAGFVVALLAATTTIPPLFSTPLTLGSAQAVLVGGAIFSSYGSATALKEIGLRGGPSVILSVFSMFVFSYTLNYLFKLLCGGMDNSQIATLLSAAMPLCMLAYIVVHSVAYIFPMIYSISFFSARRLPWALWMFASWILTATIMGFFVQDTMQVLGIAPDTVGPPFGTLRPQ